LCQHIVDISEEPFDKNLDDTCRKCKNLYSTYECETCEDYDNFE